VRGVSLLATTLGVVALLIAVVGGVAGISSYVLYEANLVSVDTSANLILTSVLCSLAALPIGFVAGRWTERRHVYPVPAQSAAILAMGTLGAWLVVVAIALGK
jgi:hypothetical protein